MPNCQWIVLEHECGLYASVKVTQTDEQLTEMPVPESREFYLCDFHVKAAEELSPTLLTMVPIP